MPQRELRSYPTDFIKVYFDFQNGLLIEFGNCVSRIMFPSPHLEIRNNENVLPHG
jgi:hypothetical protein